MVQNAEKQPRKARERLLEAAVALTLKQGFKATTVEQLLGATGLTKGAFFYHFESKEALAAAMLERWVEMDVGILHELMGRAEKLAKDPLQQLLIMVGLLEEHFDALGEPPAGCLITAFLYETGTMDEAGYAHAATTFATWRDAIAAKLTAARKLHKPRVAFDVLAVADMATSTIEGGYSLSKGYRDPKPMVAQLRNYRQYLELLFGV
jgi:TetR/AcrR family transcriptional repressor of nem operon